MYVLHATSKLVESINYNVYELITDLSYKFFRRNVISFYQLLNNNLSANFYIFNIFYKKTEELCYINK